MFVGTPAESAVQHFGIDYSITSVILTYMKTAISLPILALSLGGATGETLEGLSECSLCHGHRGLRCPPSTQKRDRTVE